MSDSAPGADPHLDFASQPIPLYMIGESHCMIFKDRLFTETSRLNQTFVTRGLFIPTITAHNFVENGALNGEISKVLMGEMLLTGGARGWTAENIRPLHMGTFGVLHRPNQMPVTAPVPILVFFVGEIAVRAAFLRTLGKIDFELPFDVPGLAQIPGNPDWEAECTPTAFALVLDLAKRILGPLFSGLVALHRMGFTSLYLHSVPPPTLNDAEFEFIAGFYTSARLRYKASLLFNYLFQEFSRQSSIRFLNIWDEVTENNQIKPEFYLDGVHLDPKSGFITLKKLIDSLVRDSREAIVPRYEYAREEARPRSTTSERTEAGSMFDATGVWTCATASKSVERLLTELAFTEDTANRHVRLDWNGAGIERWPGRVTTAKPSIETLTRVFDLFRMGTLNEIMQSCMDGNFSIASVKFIQFGPSEGPEPGPCLEHTDNCPPGVLRCIVFLTDAGASGTGFEIVERTGARRLIPAQRGTVVIFDGNQPHLVTKPASGAVMLMDVVLTPLHRSRTPCVIWAGMNNWPVDPYNFSTDGFLVAPDVRPIEEPKLSSQELQEVRLQEGVYE